MLWELSQCLDFCCRVKQGLSESRITTRHVRHHAKVQAAMHLDLEQKKAVGPGGQHKPVAGRALALVASATTPDKVSFCSKAAGRDHRHTYGPGKIQSASMKEQVSVAR